ncbi:MAG: hypothetical protein IKC74_05235 [Clostridia bacterium]|nr:hypothetical protein [Clostridia bacterium]
MKRILSITLLLIMPITKPPFITLPTERQSGLSYPTEAMDAFCFDDIRLVEDYKAITE